MASRGKLYVKLEVVRYAFDHSKVEASMGLWGPCKACADVVPLEERVVVYLSGY